MPRAILPYGLFLALAAFLSAAIPGHAQTVPITTVVTVLGPKFTPPPAITKDDLAVYEGKQKREITSWVPAQGDKAALELAIVIDDSNSSDLGMQFNDITNFIKSQPKTTGVAIFYASNGTVQAASQFNTDHDAVVKALRMPFGRGAAYSSVYLSLLDLISRWPVTGARREILLLSDGIDRFRGDPFSPDVPATVEKAQKAGIIIHTLFASGVGRFGRNFYRVSLGQSNLAQLSDGTGGESFFQGTQTPISFAPFLQQLDTVLKNQFFLSYATERSKKKGGELHSFRVQSEQRDVEISHASRVFVPGP
jgi:VWFA-related protein